MRVLALRGLSFLIGWDSRKAPMRKESLLTVQRMPAAALGRFPIKSRFDNTWCEFSLEGEHGPPIKTWQRFWLFPTQYKSVDCSWPLNIAVINAGTPIVVQLLQIVFSLHVCLDLCLKACWETNLKLNVYCCLYSFAASYKIYYRNIILLKVMWINISVQKALMFLL